MRLQDDRIRKLRRCSDDPPAAHSFTFSCFRRQRFLSRDRSCNWLIDALARARRAHGFDLWAWVIMPEHVHLVVWPGGAAFSARRVLAAVKIPVTRRAVAFVNKTAPHFLTRMLDQQPNGQSSYRFWQPGGGYDRDLHDPGTIHRTIDYIHANPVRAGLVEPPELWRWSSAAYFAGLGEPPLVPDTGSISSPPAHWRFWSCTGGSPS